MSTNAVAEGRFHLSSESFVRVLPAVALAVSPVLYAISTLTWQDDGIHGVAGAVWNAGALVGWLYGLNAVYDLLAHRFPRFTAVARLVLMIGVAGGVAFAMRGFYDGALGNSPETSLRLLQDHQLASELLMFLPGPLFPISLILLGIALAKARLVPRALGIAVAVTGVVFPFTTILRLHEGALGLSIVMIGVFGWLAYLYGTGRMSDARSD
ncbi:hypothetical protein AB0N05_08820 [Nocardia sp. NPDC051030]|uniref:hypothetical protein n=1 Tax=Nocardia sp. NPDC051030 TaxID=3155162 RepID=UPI00344AAE1E